MAVAGRNSMIGNLAVMIIADQIEVRADIRGEGGNGDPRASVALDANARRYQNTSARDGYYIDAGPADWRSALHQAIRDQRCRACTGRVLETGRRKKPLETGQAPDGRWWKARRHEQQAIAEAKTAVENRLSCRDDKPAPAR